MLRSVVAAAVAAASLSVAAPPAVAHPPVYGCLGGDRIVSEGVFGIHAVALVAYLAHDNLDAASARCYVRVNTVEVGGTASGVYGPGYAVAYGAFWFGANPGDLIEVCFAGSTTLHGSFVDCSPATVTQVPPQEVIDFLNDTVRLVDSTVCVVLREIGTRGFNVLGVVVIDSQGDVYVNGVRQHDC